MLFLSCFCYAFMHVCLLMPCGIPAGKGLTSWLSLMICPIATFPIGILGQVWCLILSIPDLALFLTLSCHISFIISSCFRLSDSWSPHDDVDAVCTVRDPRAKYRLPLLHEERRRRGRATASPSVRIVSRTEVYQTDRRRFGDNIRIPRCSKFPAPTAQAAHQLSGDRRQHSKSINCH